MRFFVKVKVWKKWAPLWEDVKIGRVLLLILLYEINLNRTLFFRWIQLEKVKETIGFASLLKHLFFNVCVRTYYFSKKFVPAVFHGRIFNELFCNFLIFCSLLDQFFSVFDIVLMKDVYKRIFHFLTVSWEGSNLTVE